LGGGGGGGGGGGVMDDARPHKLCEIEGVYAFSDVGLHSSVSQRASQLANLGRLTSIIVLLGMSWLSCVV
jgi:hypothetical protein